MLQEGAGSLPQQTRQIENLDSQIIALLHIARESGLIIIDMFERVAGSNALREEPKGESPAIAKAGSIEQISQICSTLSNELDRQLATLRDLATFI